MSCFAFLDLRTLVLDISVVWSLTRGDPSVTLFCFFINSFLSTALLSLKTCVISVFSTPPYHDVRSIASAVTTWKHPCEKTRMNMDFPSVSPFSYGSSTELHLA